MFANAYFSNSVIAILAGVLAQYAANTFGYVYEILNILIFNKKKKIILKILIFSRAPFDLSLITLIVMAVFIIVYWNENYGDAHADLKQSFITAWQSIISGLLG